jgi:dTMP kinase
VFLVLDGIDGSGKSTQVGLLVEALRKEGRKVTQVRDPGGTAVSNKIRGLLLAGDSPVAPLAELCLYAAARAQLVEEIIRPALKSGQIVVSDRFTWSTNAYQGAGRGLPLDSIRKLEEISCGDIRPNHIFILDLAPEKRQARLRKKGGSPDRLEQENDGFFSRVRDGFLALARENPALGTVVDASQAPEAVHEAILGNVRKLLK